MQIVAVASAFPKDYYPQAVLLQALETCWGAELENPELLRRLHRNTGVDPRYLALPVHAYPKLSRWGEVNDLWIEVALDPGKRAICRALTHAGLEARNLGAFSFTSVTGVDSPWILLAEYGHTRGDTGSWVLHASGPKVLEAIQDALDLREGQLDASWELEEDGQLIVGVGAGSAGRSQETAPASARDVGINGGDGTWLLF